MKTGTDMQDSVVSLRPWWQLTPPHPVVHISWLLATVIESICHIITLYWKEWQTAKELFQSCNTRYSAVPVRTSDPSSNWCMKPMKCRNQNKPRLWSCNLFGFVFIKSLYWSALHLFFILHGAAEALWMFAWDFSWGKTKSLPPALLKLKFALGCFAEHQPIVMQIWPKVLPVVSLCSEVYIYSGPWSVMPWANGSHLAWSQRHNSCKNKLVQVLMPHWHIFPAFITQLSIFSWLCAMLCRYNSLLGVLWTYHSSFPATAPHFHSRLFLRCWVFFFPRSFKAKIPLTEIGEV